MMNLLYVCSYNIDRSPVAEQITNKKAVNADLHISSAGLRKAKRYPLLGMTEEMRVALSKSGYTPSQHKSKVLTPELLNKQDIILCMTQPHVDEVLEKMPGLEGRVHTLPEYAGFNDEAVNSPPSMIKKVPAFFALKHLPFGIRKNAYRLLGKRADPRDYEGVVGVHMKIIEEIEFYVDKTLERMVREGAIPKPTSSNISAGD